MVVPFGSALERRSRTTYRPTVTPEGSTHVDTAFTGSTSSFSRTATGKRAVVAVVRQQAFECGEQSANLGQCQWDAVLVAGCLAASRASASMAKVMCRCQAVQPRTW